MIKKNIVRSILALSALAALGMQAQAQTLPTGITVTPFYDTSKAGLSFKKDKLSTMGMWEVPGKPEHFLVLGYWGFIWSLYPDMTKTYAPGSMKDYTRKELANFNNVVMKGWEQGALGGAFDPNFKKNRFFYVIYNKYANPANYHTGYVPGAGDGPGSAGLVVVERWKLSENLATLTRDTTIISMEHGLGYGSSNLVFGKDSMMYITTDAYSQQSWDSTNFMRKILRIDVSRQDPGKMYAIPPSNPWYNVSNPKVKKEVFAFGFRNTYSIQADYVTGSIWGAEVGQTTWEEVNIIKAGKNYGWANGGDGAAVGGNSIGIEGPCSPTGQAFTSNDPNNTSGASLMNPYTRTFNGRTYTCNDFTNGTWNFHHRGTDYGGSKTALPGLNMNCIILSQAFRGDPSSPFYGYHFVTDIAANYFIAVKEGMTGTPQNVGGVQSSIRFIGDKTHNGIVNFSEDSYGNMYAIMVASSGGGAFDHHDIYRLSHPDLKPLSQPRDQVFPVSTQEEQWRSANGGRNLRRLVSNTPGADWIPMPEGSTRAELYAMDGKLVWTGKGEAGRNLAIPSSLQTSTLWARFLP